MRGAAAFARMKVATGPDPRDRPRPPVVTSLTTTASEAPAPRGASSTCDSSRRDWPATGCSTLAATSASACSPAAQHHSEAGSSSHWLRGSPKMRAAKRAGAVFNCFLGDQNRSGPDRLDPFRAFLLLMHDSQVLRRANEVWPRIPTIWLAVLTRKIPAALPSGFFGRGRWKSTAARQGVWDRRRGRRRDRRPLRTSRRFPRSARPGRRRRPGAQAQRRSGDAKASQNQARSSLPPSTPSTATATGQPDSRSPR